MKWIIVPKKVKYVMKTTIVSMVRCINEIKQYWQKPIDMYTFSATYLSLDNLLTYLNSAVRSGIFDMYKIKKSTVTNIYDAISIIKKSLFSAKENLYVSKHYNPSTELKFLVLSVKILCCECNIDYDKLKREAESNAE